MSEYLRLVIWCAIIFFIPGYLLTRLLSDRREFSLWERIPMWFCLSLGILTIPGILAYVFHLTFQILLLSFIIITVLLFLLNVLKRSKDQTMENDIFSINAATKNTFLLSAVIILMGGFLIIISRRLGGYLTNDALSYIAFIRKLVENPYISNHTAYYHEIGIDPTYGYNIWHLALALLSNFSRVDPVQLWISLPIILTLVIILSFYAFVKTLFGNKNIALICSFLFMLYYGANQGMWIFRTSTYNAGVTNFMLFPIALTFIFKYLRKDKIRYLFLSSLLGFTISTIHPYGFMTFLLSLASFYFFHLLFKRGTDGGIRLRILYVLLLTILLSASYIILRLPTLKVVNPYYLQSSYSHKPFYVEMITQNLYYMNPKILCAPQYYIRQPFIPRAIYLFAFILTPLLLIHITKSNKNIFLFSNMIIPPLIMFNPILVPILSKFGGFATVDRMNQLLPFLLVIGFYLYGMLFGIEKFLLQKAFKIGQKNLKFYFSPTLCIIVLFITLFYPSLNTEFRNLFKENIRFPKHLEEVSNRYISASQYIHDNITESSVFLIGADYRFSLFLCAYTKHYVVATHPGNASPATTDIDQSRREETVKDVLDSSVNFEDTMQLLQTYNVEYVVLDSSQIQPKVLSKLESYPEIFNLIFKKNGISIFKVKQITRRRN